jgi:alpha-galactosidase
MMVEFGDNVDEENGKVLGVALEWPGTSCRRVRRNWDGSRTEVFAGVDMTTGPYTLDPGETFTTPKAVLV